MNQINSFRDLRVYQKTRSEALTLFELTITFPKHEQYSLTDQIRRSSRSVAALVAEAWGLRAYRGAFVDKLWRALSEAKETQAWLDTGLDCHYISEATHGDLDSARDGIAGMLYRMIERHESFVIESPRS